jgi:threonine dehydrogenase-like Zn-dependent dehydrogenase
VIAIDHVPERMRMAQAGGADVISFHDVSVLEALSEMTGERGPDACIDVVGMETRGHGPAYLYDRSMQAMRMETDRPEALREAILACRNGSTVSIVGVYTGLVDKFPMGAVMNRSLTIRSGQAHVQRYMRLLLKRIQNGDIDPSFVVTHHMALDQVNQGYQIFRDKEDECIKVVLKP